MVAAFNVIECTKKKFNRLKHWELLSYETPEWFPNKKRVFHSCFECGSYFHSHTHTPNKCLVGNFHANITGVSYFLEMCHFWYRLMNLLLFMPFKRDACDLRHRVEIIQPHDIQSMGQYLSISNNRIFDWSISFSMHICYGHRTGHKMWWNNRLHNT